MAYMNGNEVLFDPKIGKDGVGIAKIEQTTKSTDDGGVNIITVTLTNGVKETFEIKNGSGGNVNGDWQQNDNTQADYIKNRLCWKETKGVDIAALPETSVAFTSGAELVHGFAENSFIEGNKYIVKWNGTEYEAYCYIEDGTLIIGNGVLADMTTETAHPFCIVSFGGSACYVYKDTETDETITIEVNGVKENIVHYLDPKYIPDMYYTETKTVEILPETEMIEDGGQFALLGALLSFIEGSIYTIKYNGVEYECEASLVQQDGLTAVVLGDLGVLSGEPTGEVPFIMMSGEYTAQMGLSCVVMPLDGAESVTISIVGDSPVTHKIPEKYLPDKSVKVDSINISDYYSSLMSGATVKIEDSGLINTAKTIAENADKMEVFYAGGETVIRLPLNKTTTFIESGVKTHIFTGVVSEFSNSVFVVRYITLHIKESDDYITLGMKTLS